MAQGGINHTATKYWTHPFLGRVGKAQVVESSPRSSPSSAISWPRDLEGVAPCLSHTFIICNRREIAIISPPGGEEPSG